MLKSYYDILNISENASKSEIKKQFRKLVRMYHPDLNSSFEAEQRFKEINKAADILLDDEKRKNYDNLRSVHKTFSNNYQKNNSQKSFSDIFSKKKEEKKEEIKKPINGEDITLNLKISTNEAILGTQRIVNVAHCSVCPKCNGRKFSNEKKCSYCNGLGEKTINKKITVKIPPSIKNKAKLRLVGEGKEGKFGGKNGNLYIIVEIINDNSEFKIKDGIVYFNAEITPYQAILGGNIKVPTLWGEATIKIPPLTKSNQSFKLIDVGVINQQTGKKGDEIVKIIIQIPSSVTDEELLLYEKLKEINSKKNVYFR